MASLPLSVITALEAFAAPDRKQSVHDYLRVIADGKVAYKLVYFKLDNDKKDEE